MMAVRRYDIVLYRQESQQLTLDMLAARTGIHPALVQQFVEFGLIEPIEWQGTRSLFDVSAVPRLRMIRRLRESLGINLAGWRSSWICVTSSALYSARTKRCAIGIEDMVQRSTFKVLVRV
jgi:hypothetical protein